MTGRGLTSAVVSGLAFVVVGLATYTAMAAIGHRRATRDLTRIGDHEQ